ncbi:MAG: hypothetical protein OET90_12215 [Desulfuromonadales bacterium]|nr:hypothetical protein [Desulfuromonadales bacterium]
MSLLKDRFDQLLLLGLALVIIASALLLVVSEQGSEATASVADKRRMERELMNQARLAMLQRHYDPVVALRDSGAHQQALLKLEELRRDLPGEAHTDLLSGDLLLRMGQIEQALSRLADAVRVNGDYVEMNSPLNQRSLIESAVNDGLPLVRDRLRAQPENASLAQVLKDGYYLQSRLAGGCE